MCEIACLAQLEEPFAVLPLSGICERIRINSLEIVGFSERARATAKAAPSAGAVLAATRGGGE